MAGELPLLPIQEDEHLLTVLRYVERNPVRAGLVAKAQDWPWSSARFWPDAANRPSYLAEGPVERPANWLEWVNQTLTAGELAALRRCIDRGTPFGGAGWVARTAQRLHLETTLRPRGRPPKEGKTAGTERKPK